jgi:DNA-directed RNA polymerase omega subunit
VEVGSKMAKTANENLNNVEEESTSPEMDSKYRLIIVAAKRSKQLQRGARPRIDIDPQKHKPTRIALEEVQQGKIGFEITDEE